MRDYSPFYFITLFYFMKLVEVGRKIFFIAELPTNGSKA